MGFLPLMKHPVQLHSHSQPKPCELTPEQCAYKSRYWVYWYDADHVYALPVVYFFLAAIAVFALGHVISRFTPRAVSRSPAWRRAVSGIRFLSYRNWRFAGIYSQSLGVILLACAGIVFFAAMTLGPQPYYWPTDAHYGNSPPIATRAGFLALGCLPFILAFGSKANLVTAVTGISHERLNVWHGWVSWAMLVLGMVHAFPLIIFHRSQGDMGKMWSSSGTWLTGVIALVCQGWLTIMSIPRIRNKHYEVFKATHFFFAAAFVVFFFIHCSYRMSSWDYFIAAGVIYVACLLFAWAKTYIKHGIKHQAHLYLETPSALRINIETKSNWHPGQHMYLRFLSFGVHAVTSHPFTICSVPANDSNGGGDLVFYVQPRGGLTGRLAKMAEKQPGVGVPVILDGPYGGMPSRWAQGFDRTLLVGAGAGAGFTLPLIEDWIQSREPDSAGQLKVVLATRDSEMRHCLLDALEQIALRQCKSDLDEIPGITIHVYETDAASPRAATPESEETESEPNEKNVSSQDRSTSEKSSIATLFGIQYFYRRPDVRQAVRDCASEDGVTVGVAVCGPSGMVYDVGAEAATAQAQLAKGELGAAEVWYHKEAFSY